MIKNVSIFIAGAAIGSAVTWKLVKNKYEQIANEEIASVKEHFSKKAESKVEEPKETEETELENFSAEEVEEYLSLANDYAKSSEKGEGIVASGGDPYVITPEEFGEMDGYETKSLTYYACKTLEDENYEIVTNVDELIGKESLTHFGEYEDDCVHVRNDRLHIDFEILMDPRTYEETSSEFPKRPN